MTRIGACWRKAANGRRRTEELDRFEQTTDALLTRVLTPSQRRRLTVLFGPDFDLRLLTRKQPKPERKPASRGDGEKGKEEGKEPRHRTNRV